MDLEKLAKLTAKSVKVFVRKKHDQLEGKFISFTKEHELRFTQHEKNIDDKLNVLPKDGKDGLDALDIDIIPEIILEKSYPYGTYAKHKGGLWKALSKTRGMDGWDCIVQGLDSFDVGFDGERTFTIKSTLSDGTLVEKTFKTPNVIEKGVFKDGENYEMNDGVTFAGSYWLAKKDAPEGRPGSSDDWRLCVKAGRNGKDVVKVPTKKPETIKIGG